MKTLAKILILMVLAFFFAGAYRGISAKSNVGTELRYFHETVRQGERFNNIIEKYYCYDNEGECWDNWQTKVKEHNKMLFFYSDGSPRVLQVGDIICIPAHVKVAK